MCRLTATLPARSVWILSVSLSSWLASGAIRAQDLKSSEPHLENAVITKLAPLIYPPLARATGTLGDVEVKLEVQPDGTVASAVVLKGHPLLSPFAVENAKQSIFQCKDCKDEGAVYRLTYSFKLISDDCGVQERKLDDSANKTYPETTVSLGNIAITDRRLIFCDPAASITYNKVRSIKCLYLWRCALAHPTVN